MNVLTSTISTIQWFHTGSRIRFITKGFKIFITFIEDYSFNQWVHTPFPLHIQIHYPFKFQNYIQLQQNSPSYSFEYNYMNQVQIFHLQSITLQHKIPINHFYQSSPCHFQSFHLTSTTKFFIHKETAFRTKPCLLCLKIMLACQTLP